MTDYISREAAKMRVVEALGQGHSPYNAIVMLPAADVREVVLCKDCKYYYKDADGYEMCDNSEGYDHVTEDGFCAWAKKMEES